MVLFEASKYVARCRGLNRHCLVCRGAADCSRQACRLWDVGIFLSSFEMPRLAVRGRYLCWFRVQSRREGKTAYQQYGVRYSVYISILGVDTFAACPALPWAVEEGLPEATPTRNGKPNVERPVRRADSASRQLENFKVG